MYEGWRGKVGGGGGGGLVEKMWDRDDVQTGG